MENSDAPFPFSPAARTAMLTCWVVAVGLLALAFAPLAAGADEPTVGALLGAIFLLGLALVVFSCGAIGPGLDHHQRTGRYLIPAKGGTLRTRHAIVFWAVLAVFGGLGITLTALALKALAMWSRGAL